MYHRIQSAVREACQFNIGQWILTSNLCVNLNPYFRESGLHYIHTYTYFLHPFLDLSGQSLSCVPEDVGKLMSLQSLVLSNNKLKTIPCFIQNLLQLKVNNFFAWETCNAYEINSREKNHETYT